jgi:hypothetical protein
MTLVLAWLNRDDNPTALHLASDSLLSDRDGRQWSHGPKINRIHSLHEFIGYCGPSVTAMAAILQCNAILAATNMLGKAGSRSTATPDARVRALVPLLDPVMRSFPEAWLGGNDLPTLLYCGFDPRRSKFRLFEINVGGDVPYQERQLGKDQVLCYGSGAARAKELLADLRLAKKTLATRDVLGILKSVIEDRSIPSVGGPPQMVTIMKRSSQPVGFNWKIAGHTESTLLGLTLQFRSSMEKVRFIDQELRKSSYLHNSKIRRVKS